MKALIDEYRELGIDQVIDHEKFNHISIVHHSTRLEGSTLTATESQVLINDGLTPKGKPLVHTLMVQDHYRALKATLEYAQQKRPVTVSLIQELNGLIMKKTGDIKETMFGKVDTTKGEIRKGNVVAGQSYFPNYDKVEQLTGELAMSVQDKMSGELDVVEKLHLSFDAHFDLVSIHPFYDGNGRTSRLLMNYIQAYYELPLAIVREENKASYIDALVGTREGGDIRVFRNFMEEEYTAMLSHEISAFRHMQDGQGNKGGFFLAL